MFLASVVVNSRLIEEEAKSQRGNELKKATFPVD